MTDKLLRVALAGAVLFFLSNPMAQEDLRNDRVRASLKGQLLDLINKDRSNHGLPPVSLDSQSSEIADRYCLKQLRYRTTGHFTVDGHPPYMRYSFAGGNDGSSQNAAAWSAPYSFSARMIADLVQKSQTAMMQEQPPDDGHRRTILDPYATHVGIGMAWYGGEFRLTQEFVRRYLQWTRPLPRVASISDRIVGRGRSNPGFLVEALSVHHEAFPQPISPTKANGMSTYGLPPHRRDYVPRLHVVLEKTRDGSTLARYARYADGRVGDFLVNTDGSFSFQVPFVDGPGVYTVVLWVRKTGAERSIAASNISIRVDKVTTDPLWKYRR